MKKFFLAFLVLLSVLTPAFAAEPEPSPSESPDVLSVETQADDKDIVVNVTVQNQMAAPSAAPSADPEDPSPVSSDPVIVSSFRVVNDRSDPDEGSFAQTILHLFGPYEPRTQTVTEIYSDGTAVTHQEIVPGLAGMDWEWIAEVSLFGVFLFCVLKLIGGFFS